MNWLVVVVTLALAAGATGCGKKTPDSDAESPEGVGQADTANIDVSGTVEGLPSTDQKKSDDANVTAVSPDTPPPPPEVPSEASAAPPAVQGTGQMATYAVQKGDTLMKIAFNVYGNILQWKNIYDLNKDALKDPNFLVVGSQVKYDKPANEPVVEKNGDPYLIKKGDTLGTIADDVYGKKNKWKKIWENNRSLIHDPNKIYAGFYLYYQVTEEEKREAEELKARRGGQQLGTTPAAPSEPAPDSAAVDPGAGKDALKGGGLNSLASPTPSERVPATTGQ